MVCSTMSCMCTFYFHVQNKRHSLYFILQPKPKKFRFRKIHDFSALKTFVLFSDILNSFVPALVAASGGDPKYAAIIVFGITLFLYFVLAVVFAILKGIATAARASPNGDCGSLCGSLCTCDNIIRIILSVLEFVGGLFYFVGDNLPPLFEDFEPDKIGVAQWVAKFCLGAGIVLLFGSPLLLHECYEKKRDSQDQNKEASPSHESAGDRHIFLKVWFSLKKPVSQMPKFDAVFTAIVRIGNGCDTKGNWIADFTLCGIFLVASFVYFVCLHFCGKFSICYGATTTKTDEENGTEGGISNETMQETKNKCHRRCSCFHLVCNMVLAVCIGLYLLGDNELPLDCVMDEHARNILQSAFLGVTLLIVTLVMVGVIVEECPDSCCDCCREKCCSCCCSYCQCCCPDVVHKEMGTVTDNEPLLT